MPYYEVDLKADFGDVEMMFASAMHALESRNIVNFLQEEALPWFRQRVEKRFGSEGDDASGSWLPLAESTQKIREEGPWSVGPEHPINVRTYDLLNFLRRGAVDYSIGKTTATMYFPGKPSSEELLDKLSTAQLGRESPRTPKRPVVAANERDLRAVMTRLGIWVGRQTGMTFGAAGGEV
jgi:hypothetical protein